jgi:hypothetical protein
MTHSVTVCDKAGVRSKCGARTRTGAICMERPLPGRGRCRLHGGLSTGAPRGPKNGRYTNGDWATEAMEERRWLRSMTNEFAKADGSS